ncbi:MAG: reverse transcriptase domain-containing protein [Phocaeicola sp.]
MFEASEEGTPQGGPLSPLLSNIMLNELDKELERRGLPFVRYADDSMIFCKSKKGCNASKGEYNPIYREYSISQSQQGKDRSVVYSARVKYLGYSFYVMKGKCQLTVHPKSKDKMKSKLKN